MPPPTGMVVKKGSKIYIEGSLRTREWEKDGSKRWTTEVVLTGLGDTLKMLDGKPAGAKPKVEDDDFPF